MKNSRLSISMAAVMAAAALSGIAISGPSASQSAQATTATAKVKAQAGQANKQAPGDTKTNRLASRGTGWSRPDRGKRVSHTVAQGRRIAQKARNSKRHRARA